MPPSLAASRASSFGIYSHVAQAGGQCPPCPVKLELGLVTLARVGGVLRGGPIMCPPHSLPAHTIRLSLSAQLHPNGCTSNPDLGTFAW